MTRRRTRILGIALGDKRLTLAELGAVQGTTHVRAVETFLFPGGLSLDQPDTLGKALGERLRRLGIRTTDAVFGVPVSWALAREGWFPGSNRPTLESMIRLKVEQAFPAEGLVIDYAAGAPGGTAQPVLMAGLSATKLHAVLELATAAGLKPAGVTLTVAAVGTAAPSATGLRLQVCLNAQSAEIAVTTQGTPTVVRHVPLSRAAGALSDLAAFVRRITALLPPDASGLSVDGCTVWGNAPWSEQILSEALGLPVARCAQPTDLSVAVEPGVLPPEESVTSVALALSRTSTNRLPLDFQRSRLADPAKRRSNRKAAWLAAGAAALVLCVGLSLDDWRRAEGDVRTLRRAVASLQPDIDAARSVVERAVFARGWFKQRPAHLDCLRTVALCFPEEGRIWITSIGVREDMQTVISGQAVEERSVLETLDRLRQSPDMANVRTLYVRDGGGGSREVSFAIQFVFIAKAPRQ
jgi:hypothetical protein